MKWLAVISGIVAGAVLLAIRQEAAGIATRAVLAGLAFVSVAISLVVTANARRS